MAATEARAGNVADKRARWQSMYHLVIQLVREGMTRPEAEAQVAARYQVAGATVERAVRECVNRYGMTDHQGVFHVRQNRGSREGIADRPVGTGVNMALADTDNPIIKAAIVEQRRIMTEQAVLQAQVGKNAAKLRKLDGIIKAAQTLEED